jgi:hypothetical protein
VIVMQCGHIALVRLERDGVDAWVSRGLGHRVEPFADSYQDYGAGQFIWRLDEGQGDAAERGYAAASNPRRDGQAAGF